MGLGWAGYFPTLIIAYEELGIVVATVLVRVCVFLAVYLIVVVRVRFGLYATLFFFLFGISVPVFMVLVMYIN